MSLEQYNHVNVRLDARLEGIPLMSAPAGVKTKFYYTFTAEEGIDVVYFNGLSLFAWSSNKGDNVSLWSEYNAGPYGWKRYKKFAKNFMVYPDTEMKDILFPTTPSPGVRVVIEYDNKGVSAVDFAINLYNFVDQQAIDTSSLEEGVDW